MRFIFILMPSCFPVVGRPFGRSGGPVQASPGYAPGQPHSIGVGRDTRRVTITNLRDGDSCHAAPLSRPPPYTADPTVPNNFFSHVVTHRAERGRWRAGCRPDRDEVTWRSRLRGPARRRYLPARYRVPERRLRWAPGAAADYAG